MRRGGAGREAGREGRGGRTHLVEEVESLAIERDDDVLRELVHVRRELVLSDVEEAGAVQGVVLDCLNELGLHGLALNVQGGVTVGRNLLGPLLQRTREGEREGRGEGEHGAG